jgi:serine/threonine protein kinase
MPLEGQYLGRYRLLRLLGSGGMGEVYLAEDARIAQQVAIKVIRSEGIAYPESESAKEAARLFEREAKAIARLDHPNILPLYAYGEETLHDTLLTYLVMPYRKEGTLANWLRQRGRAAPLSPDEVAPLLQQAADALQHAHNQHVIHQDIKPTNFLIRLSEDHLDRPDLLLADFGIAKLSNATASASQSIRGTPTYMAPEQWDGHPVLATDQYALAIMVYELLVGHPPFQGGPGQVMRQHYLAPPPAPGTLNPRLPAAIDVVLLRALAKQPDERFPSVTAFARAFQQAVQSDGELHATLAISRAEAESGTTRTMTLPGGRQVSVTVPAGVGDGTTLRLEGQGMPYYAGGPAGPLMLTISIPAQASPPPLPQGSTEPTVPVSMPNAELPSVEEPSVPPARPEAPGDLEPTLPASHESESAPTVFATNAPSLPTELATPAPQTPLPNEVARSSKPPALRPDAMVAVKPAKPGASRRFVLLGLAGLVIVALASGIVWFTVHPASPTASIQASPTASIQASPTAGSISEFPVPTANCFPEGIAAGPDGNLWFTEEYGNKIGRISPSGTITEFPIPTAQSSPAGITAGPGGNLWFTENHGNKIGRISPSGKFTEFPVPIDNSFPEEITTGPGGSLWFTEYDKIGRFTPGK